MNYGDTFRLENYTFEVIKPTMEQRPYKVRCVETKETKDSAISYENAADMLIDGYKFMESMGEEK